MTRYYADDGNAQVEIETDTAVEAAQEYVDDGDWGESSETTWIEVRIADADAVDAYAADDDTELQEEPEWSWHTVTIDPDEPDCSHDEGHDWQAPLEIVGGIAENPGVWGHGGGVTVDECCLHCGCRRLQDTWAQNPTTGEQGLVSVGYDEGHYSEALAERACDDLTAEAQDDGWY